MCGAPSEIRCASGGEVRIIQTLSSHPFGELRGKLSGAPVANGPIFQARDDSASHGDAGCAVQVSLPRSKRKIPPKKSDNPDGHGVCHEDKAEMDEALQAVSSKQKRGPPLAGGSPAVGSAKRHFVVLVSPQSRRRVGNPKCIVQTTEMIAMSPHI